MNIEATNGLPDRETRCEATRKKSFATEAAAVESEKGNRVFETCRKYLNELAPGPIEDTPTIEGLLASCWHEIGGDDGGMVGYKLKGRMEDVVWSPPLLRFRIERHGATVYGSVYAEVQNWSVNLDAKTASLEGSTRRQVGTKDKRLNVEPIATALAKSICEHTVNPALRWDSEDKVKVLVAKIIPTTNQQTTSARRKRFWKALENKVGPYGWQRVSNRSQFLHHTPTR
jgi:hypothetical protein